MSNNESYTIKNPLRRDGTSQNQRALPSLKPDSFKIDEKTLQDFLVFAQEFAKQIYYYNTENKIRGDWQDFFKYDLTFILASIQKTNPQVEKDSFQQYLNMPVSIDGLQKLIELVEVLANKIDEWYRNLPQENSFKDYISRLVRTNLSYLIPQLCAYEKGAFEEMEDIGFEKPNWRRFEDFSLIWGIPVAKAEASMFLNSIKPDKTFFRPGWESVGMEEQPITTDEDKLEIAYRKLDKMFVELFNVFFEIIRSSPTYFTASLTLDTHEPHIALFVSFLYMYQQVQGDINTITKKHLDFYYKDVLRLQTRAAVPDKAHLLFTLPKHLNEYKLEEGTNFIAGKDAYGAKLLYSLQEDIVLNKAEIVDIRSVFLTRDVNYGLTGVYAAPVANSQDGNGAEFEDSDKPTWKAFGSNEMPIAEFGFAISSNELLLLEGSRQVDITINYSSSPQNPTDLSNLSSAISLSASLSGEEEFFAPANFNILSVSSTSFVLSFSLSPEQPAVIGYNEDILGAGLNTTLPTLRLLLNHSKNTPEILQALLSIKIVSISLSVNVSGVKQLLAFNDTSLLKTDKSFLPFGATPSEQSNLFIGSAEAFHKNLSAIDFIIEWENKPEDFWEYYLGYDVPGWDNGVPDENTKLQDSSFTVDIYKVQKSEIAPILESNVPLFETPLGINGGVGKLFGYNEKDEYGKKSTYGFLRLSLNRDFESEQFSTVLTRQMLASSKLADSKAHKGAVYKLTDGNYVIATSNSNSTTNYLEAVLPLEPYIPTIKSISLNYISTSNIAVESSEFSSFYHIYPFHKAFQKFNVVNGVSILPQIDKRITLTDTQDLEGSFIIGIANLKSRQNLSVLFQVAENTADSKASDAEITWQFLGDNKWQNFKSYEILSDTTKGLITSGIITFAVPKEINNSNTILDSSKLWIRACVPANTIAVSDIIALHAQAALVVFKDNGNELSHLNAPLPKETIAKLERNNPSIDKFVQPYDSFGGRPTEDDIMYYTRVSERLRHKGRALTLYDYERIILEAFPDIYKVKCMNHTNANDKLAPGNVLIAVIPDFTKLKTVNRMRPKVTRGRLDDIKAYLEDKVSPFLADDVFKANDTDFLHVVNPEYKQITFKFSVAFKHYVTAIDFQIIQLKQSIIRFLSPWAFEDGAELNFGDKVFKSSIQNFVEEQEYVEFVTDFEMYASGDSTDIDYLEADTDRTIVVPDDPDKIFISHLDNHACEPENTVSNDTLGYISINDDLEITNNN